MPFFNFVAKAKPLPQASFIAQTHTFCWGELSEPQLAARLCACAENNARAAEAYSLLQEIIRRKTGLILFDCQLTAARSMQAGRIAQLPTGEGKTLAAVVAAALLALQKKQVHILVFNDYLARRDHAANRPIYEACGLSCGCIEGSSSPAQRRAAYACNVVYVSAKEAAFDHLRDFLCTQPEQLLFPGFSVALVDEADSILIDEARIPLVLAGSADARPSLARQACAAVARLGTKQVALAPADRQVWLTDTGAEALEHVLGLGSLYAPQNAEALTLVNAALEARFLVANGRDYIIKEGRVLVVDETTGRVAENRRFPDLLQQAVETRELAEQNEPSVVYNSMSMQAFLQQYPLVCGMTGTAASSAAELRNLYELEVDVISPHLPCVRTDHPDEVFSTAAGQQQAVLACIKAAHQKGQPVLVGTQSVGQSELFSALLTTQGLPHRVLNARNDEEEAAIIAQAGRPDQITLSTNMAGRGVDIRLGGGREAEALQARAAGGLLVIGTGLNRSLRIDDQLRGRAGRQGDPGESRFFICLQDLDPDALAEVDFYACGQNPQLLRRAQRLQEGRDAEARYMLGRYSQILEEQRQEVTAQRTRFLRGEAAPELVRQAAPAVWERLTRQAGEEGVALAQRQLFLYFINRNWADYLAAMEDKRSGIHLMVTGRKNPLEEYRLFAASAFEEMAADIRQAVVEEIQKHPITQNGIDMEKAGLAGATTTWTYMIDDSASQFSRLPHLVKTASTAVKGTLFTLQDVWAKRKR